MRVLHVASEVAPFAQSGGLADVVAGLAGSARREPRPRRRGRRAALSRRRGERSRRPGLALGDGEPFAIDVGPHHFDVRVRPVVVGRVIYGFVDCPSLFDRGGTLYGPGRRRRVRGQPRPVRRARQGRARVASGAPRRSRHRRAARARLAGRARRDLCAHRERRASRDAARDRRDDPQPRLSRHLPEVGRRRARAAVVAVRPAPPRVLRPALLAQGRARRRRRRHDGEPDLRARDH